SHALPTRRSSDLEAVAAQGLLEAYRPAEVHIQRVATTGLRRIHVTLVAPGALGHVPRDVGVGHGIAGRMVVLVDGRATDRERDAIGLAGISERSGRQYE